MSKCCSKCRVEKPQTTEYFGKNNSVPGLQYWCRECTRNAIKEWAKTPKGKKIKYQSLKSKWRNATSRYIWYI
jgi:hypothetical protein